MQKRQCDYLIVGLKTNHTTDRLRQKNCQMVGESYIQLKGFMFVDELRFIPPSKIWKRFYGRFKLLVVIIFKR